MGTYWGLSRVAGTARWPTSDPYQKGPVISGPQPVIEDYLFCSEGSQSFSFLLFYFQQWVLRWVADRAGKPSKY